MNEFWNLDPIYKGFEDPSFEEDLSCLKKTVADAESFAKSLDAVEPIEGLRRGIALMESYAFLGDKLVNFAMLRQATNSRDSAASSNLGRIMGVLSGFAAPQASFESWAAKLPDLMESGMGGDLLLPCIVGFVTSALFGYLAIFTVKLLVKNNTFQYFSVYCLAVGLLTIVLNLI